MVFGVDMPSAEFRLGLPLRPFLYTVDQLSTMLELTEQTLHTSHLFHEGRDVGVRDRYHMIARNIAKPGDPPDWRVAEKELKRWLRLKGFKYYDRGTITR